MNCLHYLRGFTKAAADMGVDPSLLVKTARSGSGDYVSGAARRLSSAISSAGDWYSGLDEGSKRIAKGTLAGGIGSLLLSSGEDGYDKLRKALLWSMVGGGAGYALDRYGIWDELAREVRRRTGR